VRKEENNTTWRCRIDLGAMLSVVVVAAKLNMINKEVRTNQVVEW